MTAGRIADAVDELLRIAPRATVAALLQQAPARLRRLPGLPVTGDEDGSRYPARRIVRRRRPGPAGHVVPFTRA